MTDIDNLIAEKRIVEGDQLKELAETLLALDDRQLNIQVRRITRDSNQEFRNYYYELFETDGSVLAPVTERIVDWSAKCYREARFIIEHTEDCHYGIKDSLQKLIDLINRAGYPPEQMMLLVSEFPDQMRPKCRELIEGAKREMTYHGKTT